MKRFLTLCSFLLCNTTIMLGLNRERILDSIPVSEADSLDLKIGQMLLFGFYGTAIDTNDAVYRCVQTGQIGNLILYGRNLSSINTAESIRNLTCAFQKTAPLPLWIGIDQEGGIVNRLKPELGFPPMPSAQWLGSLNNEDTTKYYADNTGFTLSRLGINFNFAPVLDVLNSECPVLGARERCFSSDPYQIAKHAGIVIKSHRYFGITTAVKHFPGHGNSRHDSHLGVADVSRFWQTNELIPYTELLKNNLIDAVMTAHVINSQLDASLLPATLSSKIINGLLRDSLGFRGVVLSDDLMMKAISQQYSIEQTLLLTIHAGVDLLLFSNNIRGVRDYEPGQIHATLKRLVVSGQISRDRIESSYQKIKALKLKKSY